MHEINSDKLEASMTGAMPMTPEYASAKALIQILRILERMEARQLASDKGDKPAGV